MVSIRAARRYRWRLAGGRLVAEDGKLRFAPNRLEHRRPDTAWQCAAADIRRVTVRGKLWMVVETDRGTEVFRVLRASSAAVKLEDAVHSKKDMTRSVTVST